MRSVRHILVALALLLAVPAAAPAADFYVDDGAAGPAPCAEASPCATVQEGLDAAAAAPWDGDPDVVHVAAGEYAPFRWLDASHGGTIVRGAGSGADPASNTVVRPTGPGDWIVAAEPEVANVGLESLRVSHPAGDPSNDRVPVRFGGLYSRLTHVTVDVRLPSATQPAIRTSSYADLTHVTVATAGTGDGVEATGLPTADHMVIIDSAIEAPAGAALSVEEGDDVSVVRSRLSAGGGAPAIGALNSVITLDSSVARGGIGIASDDGFEHVATLLNATVDGGIEATAEGTDTGTGVALDSSIVAGPLVAGEADDGTAAFLCEHSNIDTLAVDDEFDCGAGDDNTTAAPESLFLNRAGGDYRLRGGSAAVDAGVPGPVGSASATDLAQLPRLRDGNGDGTAVLDQGAFEYQRIAPSLLVINTPNPRSLQEGEPLTFTATADDEDPGDTLTFTWSFSDGAPAQTGASITRSFAAGTHTLTVTATDPAGASATRSREIRVAAAPAPPGPAAATAGNDFITLTNLDEIFCGLGGNDRIFGLGGNDTLWGDQCNESARRLVGAAAGDGNDVLGGNDGNDRLFGSGGADELRGNAGDDVLTGGSGDDSLYGGAGNDGLEGDSGNDTLLGDSGHDRIGGGSGNDRLNGGEGKDRLTGGAGKDRLTGGSGRNSYSAGAGDDVVSARNNIRERIDCGSGRRDRATVDRRDKVRGCERVKRR